MVAQVLLAGGVTAHGGTAGASGGGIPDVNVNGAMLWKFKKILT